MVLWSFIWNHWRPSDFPSHRKLQI